MLRRGHTTGSILFIEILAILFLIFQVLTLLFNPAHTHFMMLLILYSTTGAIALIRLFVPTIRQASRITLFICGLIAIVMDPLNLVGIFLVLIAKYILFSTSNVNRQMMIRALIACGLILTSQIIALIINEAHFPEILVRALIMDIVVAILIIRFYEKLLAKIDAPKPVLDITQFDLSKREHQIVHLVWQGRAPKEISADLKVSDATIRKDLSTIYRKLSVLGLKELFVLNHSHVIITNLSDSRTIQ